MVFHLPHIEDTRVKIMAWLGVISLLLLILNQGLDALKKLCDFKKGQVQKLYARLVNLFKNLVAFHFLQVAFKKTFECDVSQWLLKNIILLANDSLTTIFKKSWCVNLQKFFTALLKKTQLVDTLSADALSPAFFKNHQL